MIVVGHGLDSFAELGTARLESSVLGHGQHRVKFGGRPFHNCLASLGHVFQVMGVHLVRGDARQFFEFLLRRFFLTHYSPV